MRQAEVVARDGLVAVMRDLIHHPERHDWLVTRVEISRLLRTDAGFRARWEKHQEVLDRAVRERFEQRDVAERMRTDVPVAVLTTYLETVLDGLIARLASGGSAEGFDTVLDLVEESVRHR